MAALTMSVPTAAGTTVTSNAATASDTLTQAQLGQQGVNLRIQTTGTASNVTISDAGKTPANNPASTSPIAMPATGVKVVYISPAQADPVNGVTITSTSQTGLTYEVYPA